MHVPEQAHSLCPFIDGISQWDLQMLSSLEPESGDPCTDKGTAKNAIGKQAFIARLASQGQASFQRAGQGEIGKTPTKGSGYIYRSFRPLS